MVSLKIRVSENNPEIADVFLDDVDISNSISGLSIDIRGGHTPAVHLVLMPGEVDVELEKITSDDTTYVKLKATQDE